MVLIKNKIKIITLIFFCLFCFTGCWDKFEPEERGFVTAMGIDKNSNGEFNISLEVPETSMFKENSGGSSSEKETENSHTETSSGSAIWSVVKDIDSKTDRRLDFGQIKVCVIGEAILKDKNLFKQTMDALERNKDIWRKVLVCTTKGRAEDILKGYTGERKTVGFFVTSYFNNNKKNTDSTLNKDLQEVLIELSMSGNTVLPLVFLNEGEIIFDGMSIINDYSFSGYGKNEIMKGYNIIKEDIEETEIVADINGISTPLQVTEKNTDIKFYENNGLIICAINVEVEGNIGEYIGEVPIYNIEDNYKNVISDYIEKCFYYFKDTVKTDSLGLSEICRKKENDLYKKYGKENSFYKMFLVNDVKVSIKGTGTTE